MIRNVLLDPFPYTDSSRMVDVIIRDTASVDDAITMDEVLRSMQAQPRFTMIILSWRSQAPDCCWSRWASTA